MVNYLTGGVLIDCTGREPLHNAVVAFEGTLITQIVRGEEFRTKKKEQGSIIDIKGKAVMPGLINMHDHLLFKYVYGPPREHMRKDPAFLTLFGIKTILKTLRSGITTVREMASLHGIPLALRDVINQGELIGPRILTCNQPICSTGGHASYLCVEADGPDNVRRAARNQLKLGADFIKVMASHDPYCNGRGDECTRAELTLEEIRAAFEEAHKWGKLTGCHAMGKDALRNCIEAGVDVVDHGAYLDRELAKLMVERSIFYTPTLSAYTEQTINPRYGRGEKWIADHKMLIKPMQDAFRVALEEGVKIVVGTDSTGRYAEEVELMREGGMGAMESLQACTRIPSEALGLTALLGTIEVGKLADVIVLGGDPITDPYALEKVEIVIKEGQIFRPEDIRLEGG
jgi:imidazolonepropionase-like amidohydrolase